MPSRVVRCVFLCCAGLLMAAAPASAQRDLEIPIQFDFINPGARSLALAGAFIGLADDATAATTNPAGLQRLAAILSELDLDGTMVEQELLARTAPKPKEEPAMLEAASDPSKEKLSEIQEHILRSLTGEDRNLPQGW